MKRDEILRALLSEYALQRVANEQEQERRVRHAGSLDPEIPKLLEKTTALFREQARLFLSAPERLPRSVEAARAQAADIRAQLLARLQAAGLSSNYLEPVYRCAECCDTGFVGDPIQVRCACLNRRLMEKVYAGANIAGLDQENFDAFDESVFPDEVEAAQPQSQRRLMVQVRDLCLRYADTFPNTDRLGIVLMGASGLGKTFLMNCIAKQVLDRGLNALKITAYQMLETMRAHHFGEEEGRRNLREMVECDLLLLDDLGTEPLMQNITREYLFSLLNERLTQRRHTVVATNLSAGDIRTRYGERVISRLLDARNVHAIRLIGRDVRLIVGKGVRPC